MPYDLIVPAAVIRLCLSKDLVVFETTRPHYPFKDLNLSILISREWAGLRCFEMLWMRERDFSQCHII